MKILHVSTQLTWRGGEQQLAYLVGELKEKGIEQEVLCAAGSAVECFCLENHLPCYTFKRKFLQIVPAKIIQSICIHDNISLIHTHDAHAHTAAYLSAIFWGNSTPLIVSRRAIFPIGTNWFSRLKYNHSSIGRIVCVSEKIAEQAYKSIEETEKLVTVHSGIDLSRFKYNCDDSIQLSELGTNLSRPYIGNISAISEEKDFFTFVNTAEAYFNSGKSATFFIIGDGPFRTQIKKYVEDKMLTNKIVFTGFQKNISGVMKQLDCFLFTSHTEGFGTTILDAMACRIPIVATKTGGIPEIVLHGHTGLLAPVKDADALAKCLILIDENPILKNELINKAQVEVNKFTKQKMASQTIDIYLQVIYERASENIPVFQHTLQPS